MPSKTTASSIRQSLRSRISQRFGRQSLRFRLTALFVVILAFTLMSFSFLLYSAFVRDQGTQFDAALYNHAVDVANSIEVNIFGELTLNNDAISSGGKIFPFSVGRSFLQVLAPDGKIIARSRSLGSSDLPVYPEDWQSLLHDGVAFRTIQAREIPAKIAQTEIRYRLLSYLVQSAGAAKFILQIAVPMSPLERERKGLLTFFLIAIPLTLIIATLGGLYLSGRALAPVADIIEKAQNLSAVSLSERLPIPPDDDELRALSLTLNDMLDRLQQAFDSQDRFIADASHQLKTPLAILRGEIDVLRSRERSSGEINEFIASVSQELDRLSRLVEDLLLLARVDAGAGSLSRRPVRLDEIALEAVSKCEVLAKSREVKTRFDLVSSQHNGADASFEIQGDPDLLLSMLQNLIDNAIKFSPQAGTVEVRVQDEGDFATVTVRDNGPGIPAEQLPRIFERFYRVQSGASVRVAGFGLGLAVARRIVEAHSGRLEVESREGEGTAFHARIKKV